MRRLALLGAVPLGLVLLAVVLLGGAPGCGTGSGSLSPDTQGEIPASMAAIYTEQAARWDIDVAFLASIGAQETDHGRHPATNTVNGSGCQGVMQLGTGGACGDFWGRNQCDGNHDGRLDILEPADNVCAAAKGLRGEKHAPPAGGSEAGYYQAACNYYGACADGSASYAAEVMARAKQYGFTPGTRTDPTALADITVGTAAAGCLLPTALGAGSGSGRVVVDPGANQPGRPLTPQLLAFLDLVAGRLPRPLIVTTGTSHSQFTSSGFVSDHWSGNAADLGSIRNGFPLGGGYGDDITAAALLAAGETPDRAALIAREGTASLPGGTYERVVGGVRVEVIWKAPDHFDHVHIGLKPVVVPRSSPS